MWSVHHVYHLNMKVLGIYSNNVSWPSFQKSISQTLSHIHCCCLLDIPENGQFASFCFLSEGSWMKHNMSDLHTNVKRIQDAPKLLINMWLRPPAVQTHARALANTHLKVRATPNHPDRPSTSYILYSFYVTTLTRKHIKMYKEMKGKKRWHKECKMSVDYIENPNPQRVITVFIKAQINQVIVAFQKKKTTNRLCFYISVINHHASTDIPFKPAASAHKATRWHISTMLLSNYSFFFLSFLKKELVECNKPQTTKCLIWGYYFYLTLHQPRKDPNKELDGREKDKTIFSLLLKPNCWRMEETESKNMRTAILSKKF